MVLKEWKEAEEKSGGMGRSDVGIFGPGAADFPLEVHSRRAGDQSPQDQESSHVYKSEADSATYPGLQTWDYSSRFVRPPSRAILSVAWTQKQIVNLYRK